MKKRVMLLTAISLMMLLTGCGSVFSGTQAYYDVREAKAPVGEETNIIWFDGVGVHSALITVSRPIKGDDALEVINESEMKEYLPSSGLSTWSVVKLNTEDDISTLYDVYALNRLKQTMDHNGEPYDASAFKLQDGYYAYMIPNGVTKYILKVGDTYFEQDEEE